MNPAKFLYNIANPENNVSKTGYRALFLLLKLIEKPRTREELISLVSQDAILKNDISKDTLTVTINTLRKAGCVISRPTAKIGNKYILKSHPFNIKFSQKDVGALLALRNMISTLDDLQLLLLVNNFYEKIAYLAPDEESKDLLLYGHALKNIDNKILNELIIYTGLRKVTNILYDSPKNGAEEIYFIPDHITFENGKVYVWGYYKKYSDIIFLRVDRILRINLVIDSDIKSCDNFLETPECIEYQLKGYSAKMYSCNKNETIVCADSKKEYPLTIKAHVNNKFNFYQRLLSYGLDCKILSPEPVKKEFLKIIRDIKAGYENEV